MPLLTLCLLPLLVAQQPAPQAATETPTIADARATGVDPAGWLPADTMVAITVQANAHTDLSGVLAKIRDVAPAGIAEQVEANLFGALESSGLDRDDLLAIARGGAAIGITGFAAGPEPRYVGIVHLGQGSDRVQAAFATVARSLRGLGLHGGIHGDFFVAGNDSAAVEAAVTATGQSQPQGLAVDPTYRSACAAAPFDAAPACTVFVRPAALFDSLEQALPAAQRTGFARAGETLAIDLVERAILRVDVTASRVVIAGTCSLPPDNSLLATMIGNPAGLSASLARGIPAEATDFTFAATDIGACIDGILAVVQAVEPGAAVMANALLTQFDESAGVNIRRDLLGALDGRSIGFTLPTGKATLIGLANGKAFDAALTRLLAAGQLPVRRTTASGIPVYRIEGLEEAGGLPVTFAVLDQWLGMTENEATLITAARQLDSQAPNQQAAAALQRAPAGTTMLYGTADGRSSASCRRSAGQAEWRGVFDLGAAPSALAGSSTGPQGEPESDPVPQGQLAALQNAEADPKGASIASLAELAGSTHAGVAARATWLMAQREEPQARVTLAALAESSDHAEVRVQAMHALLRTAHASSLQGALAGLDDKDARVRTMAAQLLGKLRRDDSTGPLLAMVAARSKIASASSSTIDLEAAILALADLGTPELLLPAASAVDGCRAKGAGQALVWLFQNHSTRLPADAEATLMVAVLGHSEQLLRRYAIGRLGELRKLTTVKALEGRLATEGPELRPLVEVALAQIRRRTPASDQPSGDASEAGDLLATVTARWQALTDNERIAAGGFAGLCAVAFVVLCMAVSRQRRARRHAATRALVGPSEQYLEAASQASDGNDAPHDVDEAEWTHSAAADDHAEEPALHGGSHR